MELLDDVGQVEGCFDSLGEGVKLSEKLHGMRRMYHGQGNRFGRT
jgi:hypothetical protein